MAKRYDCRGKLIRNLISTIVNDNDTDAGLKNHEDWIKKDFACGKNDWGRGIMNICHRDSKFIRYSNFNKQIYMRNFVNV